MRTRFAEIGSVLSTGQTAELERGPDFPVVVADVVLRCSLTSAARAIDISDYKVGIQRQGRSAPFQRAVRPDQ